VGKFKSKQASKQAKRAEASKQAGGFAAASYPASLFPFYFR
jgi:hypothetical protein